LYVAQQGKSRDGFSVIRAGATPDDRSCEVVAILGITGRLGRALQRTGRGRTLVGMARSLGSDRRDRSALVTTLRNAVAVVDLCAFAADDARLLCEVARNIGLQEVPLVFASSLAERPVAAWTQPESADDPPPADAYGQGKRAARLVFEQQWPGPVRTLLLPQLVAPDDREAREKRYLEQALQEARVFVPGSGDQRPALAEVDTVAEIVWRLLDLPALPTGHLQVAHPHPQPLRVLVQALLDGAGLAAPIVAHPDPAWRGPHSGGDEPVQTDKLANLLPGLTWRDLTAAYQGLGRVLATCSCTPRTAGST
jgi:hypothetical protein